MQTLLLLIIAACFTDAGRVAPISDRVSTSTNLAPLPTNATSNGGDASRVGIETKVKYERYYC